MKTLSLEQAAEFEGRMIDVRLADDFSAGHLPGAVNNCVYEVAFGERMASLVDDREAAICVYGESDTSAEASMAADKLSRAGYPDVSVFAGGVAAWRSGGRKLEGDGERPAEDEVTEGRHSINLEESHVLWVGRNLLNRHWGTVKISAGWIEMANGTLTGGEFSIDMNAIECSDLDDNSGRGVLVAHLQSDDFFDTANHPEALFQIGSARRIEGAALGEPNLHIDGELTLKGVTRALSLEAVAGLTTEGKPAAQATLAIDRTLWNVIYGSGKLFHRLAGHLVNDLIELQIKIVGR